MPPALPPSDPPSAAIIVTGRALPDPVAERAYSVRKISRDELKNAPSHQLDRILITVPGLQLFRRSDSTSGHPTSQGVTLRSLGGNASSRALVVLDGVPQADPFGGWIDWPAYDPASLADVRVTRGGGAVSHGAGALAGVIELDSLASPGTEAGIEAGSRRSFSARTYLARTLAQGVASLDIRGSRSNGFIPVTAGTRGPVDRTSPYREASVRGRWVVPVGDGLELQAGALGFVDVRQRGLRYTDNRTRGADLSARLVDRSGSWAATAYAQWRNFRSSFASANEERTAVGRVALQDSVPARGAGLSVEARPSVGQSIELRLGADARFTSGETRELYAYSAGAPTRRRIAGGDSVTAGIFAEGARTRGPLLLSIGARIDRWRIGDGHLTERSLASGIASRDEHDKPRVGWRPTARAGATLDLGNGLGLRSAAYLGWRLPTLNELFRPFRAGPDATAANPLLDPERLAGAEAGIDFRRGRTSIGFTAFSNRLSDSIANVTLGHGPGVFPGVGFVAGNYRQRLNVDGIAVRGLEATAALASASWSVRLGASFAEAKVRASGLAAALDGLRPAQTPKLSATAELGWSNGGRSLSLLLHHSGPQFEDDLNRVRLPSATTVGAFAAWPLARRIQFVARGENLFNALVVAGRDDDGTTERATPRTLWIGLRFTDL